MLNINWDACFFCRVQYWNTESCPNWFVLYAESEKEHIQGCQTLSRRLTDAEWTDPGSVCPGGTVQYKGQQSEAISVEKKNKNPDIEKCWEYCLKKCLEWSETPFDNALRTFKHFDKSQMLLKNYKERRRNTKEKGKKIEKNRVAVCSSSATSILSFSVFWLF